MSDAPERIWASVDPMYPEHHGGFWWGKNSYGTEYRRADLPPTLAQAMTVEEVRELVKAVQWVYATTLHYDIRGRDVERLSAALHRIKGETE
jgi:hypothetical protein